MSVDLQEFKCPNCGGGIKFSPGEQQMVCPYCDSVMDVQAVMDFNAASDKSPGEADADWRHAGDVWRPDEQQGMVVYSCRSCGGEIVGDETLGATSCPFCDNPIVMTSRFTGALRPDLVIPFKQSKEQAMAALKKHYLGKRLLPKVFQDENHLEEVKGVYVPFWLFDAEVDVDMEYTGETRQYWNDSDYDYVRISIYRILRAGSMDFAQVPVDGSEAIDDALMESIEPFTMEEAVDFQTAYLAGYFANKYDVDMERCEERANERIASSAKASIGATVHGYSSLRVRTENVALKAGSYRYALLPVWFLSTIWRGQSYSFAMNGQTGKISGDLPLDKRAYRKWFAGIFGLSAAVLLTASLCLLAAM